MPLPRRAPRSMSAPRGDAAVRLPPVLPPGAALPLPRHARRAQEAPLPEAGAQARGRRVPAHQEGAAAAARAPPRAASVRAPFRARHGSRLTPRARRAQGDRSTTTTSREIFAAAMDAVDAAGAARVRKEKNWRFGCAAASCWRARRGRTADARATRVGRYARHIVEHLRTAAKSEANALKMAQAGLDKMYEVFDVVAEDGSSMKLRDALVRTKGTFHTHTIKGRAATRAKKEIVVPYKCYHTGEYTELRGQALKDQVDRWAAYGTIEPDCAAAIKEVVDNPNWTDLSGKHFVLLGATSAMGPFHLLKDLGAHIIAVDLNRPAIWKRIIEAVEDSAATVTFAMREPYSGQTGDALYAACGANLMTEFPQIANWLNEAVPKVRLAAPLAARRPPRTPPWPRRPAAAQKPPRRAQRGSALRAPPPPPPPLVLSGHAASLTPY